MDIPITKENWAWVKELIDAEMSGKTIQVLGRGDIWVDAKVEGLVFNRTKESYRIKPEPKLVPYTEADARWLVGRKAKSKHSTVICLIAFVNPQKDWVVTLYGLGERSLSTLLEEFLDVTDDETGKPFGREVVE